MNSTSLDGSDIEMEEMPGLECPEEDYSIVGTFSEVVGGYISMTVSAFGILANILAILIFARRGFKSNFTSLLIALAVCDLLFLVLCVIENARRNFLPQVGAEGSATRLHHHLFPYFLYPLHNILLSASIFMTVSISIERYLAIFHPLVYKLRRDAIVLVAHITPVLLLAIMVNIPKFLESEVVIEDDVSHVDVTDLRMSREYSIYYVHWTRFILLGLLPFICLLVLNFKIYRQISKLSSFKKDKQSSVILLLVAAVFLVCHAPRLALNMFECLEFEQITACGPPVWSLLLKEISSDLLPIVNSSVNLIIYLSAEPRFRQALLGLMSCQSRYMVTSEEEEVDRANSVTETLAVELKEVEKSKLLIES